MVQPTVDEWAKMSEAEKVSFNRKVNYGSAAAGAVAGLTVGGPLGAAVGAVGALLLGSWYAHKNLPGGLF